MASGVKIPYAGHLILFLQSKYGKIWLLVIALLFASPTLERLAAWKRRSIQRGLTASFGLHSARLDGIDDSLAENQRAIREFSEAISEYAPHLQSHTAVVKGMSESSHELWKAAQAQKLSPGLPTA